jgi:hypothetical protein
MKIMRRVQSYERIKNISILIGNFIICYKNQFLIRRSREKISSIIVNFIGFIHMFDFISTDPI